MKERSTPRSRAISFKELGRRLVERGGAGILDTDLDALRVDLSDALVNNLLAEMADKCGASSLGDLLSHPRAPAVAPQPGGVLWGRLEQELLSWAENLDRGAGGPRGTAPAAGVPGPPRDLAGLQRWAREQDVEACLDHPASRLAHWLDSANDRYLVRVARNATVGDCLGGDRVPMGTRGIPLSSSALARAARAYLWYRAGRRRVEQTRKRHWARRLTDPVLRTFSRNLQRRLRQVTSVPEADVPVVFDEAPLELREEPPELAVRFSVRGSGAGQLVLTRLSLLGVDQEPLRLDCTCGDDEQGACPHRRVLLEWALDALHDPHDALHQDLTRIAAVPSWFRLVESLAAGLRGSSPPEEQDRELAWRLGGQGIDLDIRPVVRTRLKSGRWGRGRQVSPTWLLDEEQLLEPRDREALASLILAERQDGSLARARLLAHALEALVDHPTVFARSLPTRRMKVRRLPPVVVLRIDRDERQGDGRLALLLGAATIPIHEVAEHALGDQHLVQIDERRGECIVAPLSRRASALINTLTRHSASLPPESHLPLLEMVSRAQPDVEVEVPEGLRVEALEASSDPVLRLDPLRGGGLLASLLVRPLGAGAAWPPANGPIRVLGHSQGRLVSARRDMARERELAHHVVERLSLAEIPYDARPFRWRLNDQEEALDLLVAAGELGDELPIEWPEGGIAAWSVTRSSIGDLRVRVGRLQDWFGIDGVVEVEGESVSLADLLEAVKAGRRYVRIGPGRFARLEATLRDRLRQADEVIFRQGEEGDLVLGKALAGRLADIFPEEELLDGDRAWLELRARMERSDRLEVEVPEGFRGTMRSYQIEGFRWLARLAHWEAGACLADDMGLGKTIQALALLLHRAPLGPALVVAPTSVGPGWVKETERFAPSLRPRLYRGPRRRELLSDPAPGDVLITSYDLLALDIDLLVEREFATLILDEAQAIKNPRTQRARAAYRVRAPFRAALTGTPLENHLGELWSIYHAVSPGLLGPWDRFVQRFAGPIERDGDLGRRDLLVQRIRPFLLRRTKAEVAPELPPRTEVIEPVELSDDERELYSSARRDILESLAARGDEVEGRRRVAVLAGITRLRLMACHPRLYDADSLIPSAKLAAVLARIEGLQARGERALIFSQFTSHLGLLREALDFREVPYLYLDGRTPANRRAKLVEVWAEGSPALFLISLKAGGTGLNLMGADFVIHLDPWWNPAVEDQAADRTHRIGQTRPVTVVRMIAQGTIEEAVLELHEHKRELARSLLEGSDAAARLSAEELLDLVRWGENGDGAGESFETPLPIPSRTTPSEPPRSLPPPATPAPTEPAPDPREQRRSSPPDPLFSAKSLEALGDEMLRELERDHDSGAIQSRDTLTLYRRVLNRFLRYLDERGEEREDIAQSLEAWREEYLKALEQGTYTAPASEPTIASTVLKRLERLAESE